MAGFEKGDVIRVSDWPGTAGRRFVVEEVVEVPTSEFPLQVYCREVERGRGVTVFRAFPADRCRRDTRAARRMGLVVGAICVVLSVLAVTYPAVAKAAVLEASRPVCSIDWKRGPEARVRLIRCAVKNFGPVPGGWKKAVEVARCESYDELRPRAGAREGDHVGIFQLSRRYYPGWYAAFGRDLDLPRARTNARTNVIVAIRMANAWGWSAWSCA